VRNPNRPAIPNARDAAKIRRVVRPAIQNTVPEPHLPITSPGYLATADADIVANGSGPFTVQNGNPNQKEGSQLGLTAYTLSALQQGDTAFLTWVSAAGSGGGYWLAVGGEASLCFSPCDLFGLLETLSLNSDARQILSRMQLDCGCAQQETVSCAECKDGAMPANVTVLISGVEVNPYDPVGVPDIFVDPDGHAEDLTLYGPSIKEQFNQEHQLEMPGCANFKTLELELADRNAVVQYVASLSINFGENDAGTFKTWNAVLSLSRFFGGQVFEYYFSGEDLGADCFGVYAIDFSHLTAQFNSGSWTDEENPYLDLRNLQIIISPTVQTVAAAAAVRTPLTGYLNGTYFYNPGVAVDSVTFPLPESPNDNDFVKVVFGGTIGYGETVVNNLSFSGGTVFGEFPAAVASGSTITLQYSADFSRWYVV